MAKIMVVDDNPILRTVIKKFLEGEGYEVMETENGQGCLEELKGG
jgi:CheY-like chemotaxis protein